MAATETPDLLFFDTFSHDTSEELNLDLVQFPKSVYVKEIRIIPLGARVEGDFPGGVRLGATNPTKFHIDFFVNDLSKPGACTFEALGSLDYCQNGQIHMECEAGMEQVRIPTDGLVLKGWYTTITLAVYGNLTQVIPETPILVAPPPSVQRPAVVREPPPVQQPVAPNPEWTPEPSNPIPSYTGAVVTSNPETYGPNNYPENYDTYRNDYYDNNPPKDPRTYHHMEDNEWEKREISCERDRERIGHSPRSLSHDRDRRDGRSRRRSLDRRSRESSRLRDRSREERIDRQLTRSRSPRSRDREGYVVKGEYRPRTRSRSRSIDRLRRASPDRDWDRDSYKKDEYRRRRDASYDRSRGGSYEKDSASYERRSPFDKRGPSYERKGPYEKRLSPYEKRGSSYERRAPSPYDRKRHSPYRVRGSSYSRSPSRDDPRKRPRTPPGESSRRPLSPREGDVSSPIHSIRSEEGPDYDRSGKQIPRVDFYHQSYRHKTSIRSPSQEAENAAYVEQHTSLVTVPLVDNPPPKPVYSPNRTMEEDKSVDAEQFEPILSDEDICDDLEGSSYMDVDYDVNDYCGVDDIIKYYNPFKTEWTKYEYINKIHLLAVREDIDSPKNVLTVSFEELCDANADLLKLSELTKGSKKTDHQFSINTFTDIDNPTREEWVHQCEQMFQSMTHLCKNTDIVLRIFPKDHDKDPSQNFVTIRNLLLTFCRIGLNFEFALAQQQPTYKIRHMKCGIRLAEALTSHRHSEQVVKALLEVGIDLPLLLLDMYAKEYMALSIRLMILQSLNACLSSKLAIDNFMTEKIYPKFNKNETDRKPKNGYQALITIMQTNPLTRIKFSVSALIKKLNMYELLGKIRDIIFKLHSKSGSNQKEEGELTESDTNFVVDGLEEILHMYRTQCFHISQPKRFLPVAAQFDINKECSNEILLEFFKIHQTLEVCLFILTSPATCNNLVVVSPIHDLIHELIHSENGINFLYRNIEMSELLFKTLIQPYGQQNTEEFIYPHDLSNYTELQILALEMAYRLRAIYHLQSICDLQAGTADENELIDRLQSLYCLSFGSIGKTAVPDIVVMADNADCLMEVFENDLKNKIKTESPSKQKSPAKGYAIELIVAAIRYSAHVPFLKKYGQRLIAVSKEHDRFEPSVSSVLQEVIPYLKPIEKPTVLAGDDMAELIEIIKAGSEHSPDLPGELTTCVRILRHFCISDYEKNVTIANETPTEEYVDLKYKYNCFQLFSHDGVAHLAGILDKLVTHFDQPSMHTSFFASAKGLQLAQLMFPCLRLLDEMLARVVRCRGPRFRDLTAAPVLLKTYGIAKAFPVGSVGFRTAAKAAEAAVRALLAYAQPIADDANDGDSIRRGPWTSLCSEVISYIMTAPYTFVPGLLVFSELLPLPLPMQTKTAPTERELADAANERRLWSAHLHALSNDLTDMIQIICMSTYRPVVHMLRRVCVQIADLAPNTAATVAKAALGAVTRELKSGEPANASAARVLGFLACLVSHAPVKSAVLHAMNSGGPKADEVKNALCAVLTLSNASNEHAAAQEFAAHALAAFCDIEITLTPATAVDVLIANSLPDRDALNAFLEASAGCLESTTKTCAVAQAILRAYFVLTDHEYGFQQFRKFVVKKRDALGKFFKWCLESSGEDRAECLSLYVDLIRILKGEEGEGGPVGRKTVLTVHEMADMVGYAEGEADHPVLKLETIMKERNSEEDALAASFLMSHLLALPPAPPPAPPSPSPAAPSPPRGASPLASQFLARCVRTAADSADERLTTSYWLNLPAVTEDEDANESELVSCDLVDLARLSMGAGGAEALCAAVRRLAGVTRVLPGLEPGRPDLPPSADDKRPPVALSRVRGECAVDAFRSRPPNTSRPPSLHVDDFTALHHKPPFHHHPPHPRGMRRGLGGSGVAVADRGRFASAAPVHHHHHYRHLRGRGAWEGGGGSHFGHFAHNSQYIMGGMGWGGGRMQRGPRHRSFMR